MAHINHVSYNNMACVIMHMITCLIIIIYHALTWLISLCTIQLYGSHHYYVSYTNMARHYYVPYNNMAHIIIM